MRLSSCLTTLASICVLISCSGGGGETPPPVTIGGMVSGLTGSGLILENNGDDPLAVAGDGSFTFASPVSVGDTYSVSVRGQPSSPIQSCRVSGGSGTAPTVNVTSVVVTCTIPVLDLFAGSLTGCGSADGAGAVARFCEPNGIALDPTGNLFVVDYTNNTIRKVTPAGVVSTFAGTALVAGSADGTGGSAQFNEPLGIAIDSTGNVYVGDQTNSRPTIRKISAAGAVTTLQLTGGPPTQVSGGFAIDATDNLYVADSYFNVIEKISPAGVVSVLAGIVGSPGSADGSGPAAQFNSPRGAATDSAGNIYVADTGNATIRKITTNGLVSTFAGTAGAYGSADGIGAAARFDQPWAVATDAAGNVYVADNFSNTIRKITPDAVVTTLAGTAGASGHADGLGSAAQFNGPQGVVADPGGTLYVADANNNSIRKITSAGFVATLAGVTGIAQAGSADGVGAAAQFNDPHGPASDSAGNIYVADTLNSTIREITPAGVVTTIAGTAGVHGGVDGTGSAAQFCLPGEIASDAAGNLYVADAGPPIASGGFPFSCSNNSIRKITPGGVVTTLPGTAGLLEHPGGVAVDATGNIYVADTDNNFILRITAAGVVSTFAGKSGVTGSADGLGAAAQFYAPAGLAVDVAGNVYVCDAANSTIRKITPNGQVSTFAGTAGAYGSADGIGAAAQFSAPNSLTIDSQGNVYVADYGNHTIRRITPDRIVSTIVGAAHQGGFTAGDLPGHIGYPTGVTLAGTSLYITLYDGVAVVQDVP